MSTWYSEDEEQSLNFSIWNWVLVALRGLPLVILVFGGLIVLLICRVPEQLLNGPRRPLTPLITSFVCRNGLRLLGIRYRTKGTPLREDGAMVANHASWLDIFSLNAAAQVYFVSKAEVAGWPVIGWLARATGAVFVARDPRQAAEQKKLFEKRLHMGHKLVFFPEGTSTDGLRVLPFKSTLFAAFFEESLRDDIWIQPVSVVYHAPDGEDARFYGWWGDMEFAPHLLKALGASKAGAITVVYHNPLRVRDHESRKALALASEEAVRSGVRAEGVLSE